MNVIVAIGITTSIEPPRPQRPALSRHFVHESAKRLDMNDKQIRRPPSLTRELVTGVWRLTQLSVALGVLYSLVIQVANEATTLLAGTSGQASAHAHLTAAPVASPLIRVVWDLPDPLAEVIIVCIVTGVVTYFVLSWVCSRQWVQEKVSVEKCWEEVRWYNPFSWFSAIVCTVVEVLKWVLKLICGWTWVAVLGLVITCIALGVLLIL
jgi:hypothetical protein